MLNLSQIKRFNGTSWVNITPKRYNGSNWVDAQGYKFDGTKRVNITTQQYTKTWEATWSQTYRENGARRTDFRGNMLCQGKYADDIWGHMRSLCGFDDADIRATLSGAKIEKVELYLKNEHWYYYSGGTAIIGYHNHATEPDTFSHSLYNAKQQKYSSRGQAQWITMPNSLGEGIRDNKYKGFSIYAGSASIGYYGVFYGANSSYKPKLKITYSK